MRSFSAFSVLMTLLLGGAYGQITDTLPVLFTKTVGLDPAVCAPSQSIDVPPASQVFYCYEASNNSAATVYEFHDLVDDQLGVILSNFPFAFGPGQSVWLTVPATIVSPTVNVGQWTFSGPDVPTLMITDTATVTTAGPLGVFTKTVGLDPAVCASTDAISVPPATEVVYCYSIENTSGSTYSAHSVVDDQLGSLLDGFLLSLSPGASAFFTVTSLLNATTTNVATWTMQPDLITGTVPVESTLAAVPTFTGVDSATVTVDGQAAVLTKTVGLDPAVCAASDSISVAAGTEVVYCYEIENTSGSTYSTHSVVDDQLGTLLDGFLFNLSPGASAFFTVTSVLSSTTTNVATWTLSSPGLPSASVTDSALVTVEAVPPPRLDGVLTKTVGLDASGCATGSSIEVPAGSTVAYCYTFHNLSTIPLNYHTLQDDQLGTLFADRNTPVPPDGVIQEIVTATITADVVNNATWTAAEGPAANPGPSVARAASAEVRLAPPVVEAPIPTLSEWGVLLLGLLLLGAGVLVLRREDPEGS